MYIFYCVLTPFFFFFNDTATTEIYTLSLHDALPICRPRGGVRAGQGGGRRAFRGAGHDAPRSEEHTSELQSRPHLVCRLLLEKKKKQNTIPMLSPRLSHLSYHTSYARFPHDTSD